MKTIIVLFLFSFTGFFIDSAKAQGLFDFGGEATTQYNRGKLEQDSGNLKEAVRWYKKAIETEPRHYESYNNIGFIYGSNGYHEKAIGWYKKSIQVNPKFVQGLSNLGASYIELGKEKLAVDVLKKARALDPESQLVANNYATALRGVGNIEESIEILKSIKNEEDPLLVDPAIKAQQYRIAGKFELAEKAYRDAIKKDPLDLSLIHI